MKRFYACNKIGDGTEGNEFRPNLPENLSFSAIDGDGQFLVKANVSEQQHLDILALGNIEIVLENVVMKAKELQSALMENDIENWRDN